ncbi:Uncharacterized protein OBRU01_20208 [Operophtera brumata]|uniref:Uncharacterized protein n=1 Tax=Operophtera brumata TaxID=104452 RepID=A0A0L7KTP9_OPEBR|nr:Uncharacterized protein OBRU01_20208 [Operophtera brumata]
MSCKLSADKSMVFRTISNIGVSLEQVLDIYINCGDETHVCAVAAAVLEAARGELLSLPPAPRRRALARCKDLHEAALSSLQVCTHWYRLSLSVCGSGGGARRAAVSAARAAAPCVGAMQGPARGGALLTAGVCSSVQAVTECVCCWRRRAASCCLCRQRRGAAR